MPTNISALTATPIASLPASISEDMGTVAAIWFSYLAVAGDVALGVFASADGGAAVVGLAIYTGPAAAPVLYQGLSTTLRQPFEPPVTPGTTYFFKITNPSAPTPLGVNAALAVQRQPALSLANGALVIGDDSFTNPPTIVALTSATILGVPNIIGGTQFMDTVSSGILLCDDESVAGRLRRFSADLTTEFTPIDLPGAPSIDGIRSDRNDTFFIATHSGGSHIVYAVSGGGVLSGTTWTISATAFSLAPSSDDTILYWTPSTGNSALSVVHRHDLGTDTPLSDLLASDAPFFVTQDMLALSDGTLLIGYGRPFLDFKVKHVSAAGAILATYPFGDDFPDAQLNFRMTLSVDQLSFWLKTNPIQGTTADTQRLHQTRISDGVSLNDNTFFTFTFGFGPELASPTDPPLFGPGPSTPIAMLIVASPATLTVIKAIDPPGDVTTVFPYATTGGLSPGSFTLVGGASRVFAGIMAGTYGVAETPPIGWVLESVIVSNGNPASAIVLAGGDAVTVTFTNKLIPLPVPGLLNTGKMHVYGYAAQPGSTLGLAPGSRMDIFNENAPHHQGLGVKVESSQPLGNPFVADKNGYYSAYVVPEPIDLQSAGDGVDPPERYSDVLVLDPRIQSLQNSLLAIQQSMATLVAGASGQVNQVRNIATGLSLGGSLTVGVR